MQKCLKLMKRIRSLPFHYEPLKQRDCCSKALSTEGNPGAEELKKDVGRASSERVKQKNQQLFCQFCLLHRPIVLDHANRSFMQKLEALKPLFFLLIDNWLTAQWPDIWLPLPLYLHKQLAENFNLVKGWLQASPQWRLLNVCLCFLDMSFNSKTRELLPYFLPLLLFVWLIENKISWVLKGWENEQVSRGSR